MHNDAYTQARAAAEKKSHMVTSDTGRYLVLSMLAGAYLTIVGLVYWSIKHNFGHDPLGKVLASLFFGVGLCIIVFTKAELFTSSNMFMAIGCLAGNTSVGNTLRVWLACWGGNLLGAVLVAVVLVAANVLQVLPHNHALLEGAHHKMAMPASEIFFKGILANWIVCLAVWVNLQLRDEAARLVAIILVIAIFLYLGFEHSVANMGTFAMALGADNALPLAPMVRNLLWSTLGNIVGGGVAMGLPFWFLNAPVTKPTANLG